MTGIGPCGITSAGTRTAQRFLLRTSFQVGTQPPKVTVQHPCTLVGGLGVSAEARLGERWGC